jgi:hypothetical protein
MRVDGTAVAQLLESRNVAGEELPMTKSVCSVSVMLIAFGLGCTANVENPKVDQTGRNGDSVAVCTKSCDDTQTSCVAKCNDDSCKATCNTDHDHCTTQCTSAPAPDGG